MDYIVETCSLTKRFGSKTAADQVNMHIQKGDIYGFIGKNGAGKTTTMKMILGLSFPTSGSLKLFGSTDLDRQRRRIGSLIESPGLYKNCSAYENLKRFSKIYGGTDQEIREILSIIGLSDTGSRKAGKFSLGMRQRLGIGIALLGSPELLVLDEPINGLDPAAIKEVRDTLLELNQRKGTTILISSHLLDELAKITTRYGIINNGVLVEEVDAETLAQRCRQSLCIGVNDMEKALRILKNDSRYAALEMEAKDGQIDIYSEIEDPSEINRILVMSGVSVNKLNYSRDSFEQYFIERIGK